MESREGLLISIIDTAQEAERAFSKIDRLVAELLGGVEVKLICSQILDTTIDAREVVQHERRLAEQQQLEGA